MIGGKAQYPFGCGAFFCYNFDMAFDPNKVTFFAQTDARGKNVQFGIKAKDRQRHVYVIGKTGMGKSTLLENMAVQDIQNGEGMAFIDPHGSAAETILNYIPEHRINDVLYFAPFDTEHPVSFNIMEDVGPDKRHLVVSGLMSVFKKIWIDAWSARMEYILQNTLLALLEYPDSTLLGVNRMLSDKDYRNLVVSNVKDPGVKAFWVDEFAKYNERYMQEAGDAIKNKIGQFTANPIIRNIIGQPKSSFDIRQMMDEKKILIMNLSKGLIGESNANLLGSMLTTRIYLAAMSRADLPPEKMRDMPNFYFYVDEFQSFANATFANILSEARKYHLNLTIAHQYIEQMEEEVRNAVFGNVGTIISFRVGPFDAEVLETIFTPQFLAADIVNLGARQIYLTLMIDGLGSQPFSAATLPPIAPPGVSYKGMALAASREKFTKLRPEVEEAIEKFHERVVIPKKVTEKPIIPEAVVKSEKTEKAEHTPDVSVSQATVPKKVFGTSEDRDRNRPVSSHSTDRSERPATNRQRGGGSERRDMPRQGQHASETRATPRIEDLRSVLSKIVQTSQGEGGQKQGVAERPQRGSSEKHELKDALSAVLRTAGAEVEKNPSSVPVVPSVAKPPRPEPQRTPPIPEHTHVIQAVTKPEAINTPKEVAPVVRETPVREQHDVPSTSKIQEERSIPEIPSITPKELERMMRVTTNDTPPL